MSLKAAVEVPQRLLSWDGAAFDEVMLCVTYMETKSAPAQAADLRAHSARVELMSLFRAAPERSGEAFADLQGEL